MSQIILGTIISYFGKNNDLKANIYCDKPKWLNSNVYIDDRKLEVKIYPYKGRKDMVIFKSIDEIENPIKKHFYTYLSNLPNNSLYVDEIIGLDIIQGDQKITTLSFCHDFGGGIILEGSNGKFYHEVYILKIDKDAIYIK